MCSQYLPHVVGSAEATAIELGAEVRMVCALVITTDHIQHGVNTDRVTLSSPPPSGDHDARRSKRSCISPRREIVGHATENQDTETLHTGIMTPSSYGAWAYDIERRRRNLLSPRNPVNGGYTPMWKRTILAR